MLPLKLFAKNHFDRSLLRILFPHFILGSLITTHFLLLPTGTNHSGISLVVENLYNFLVVSAFLFIILTIGSYTLTRCGFSFDQPLEKLIFSIAIGGSLLSLVILLCGALGGFHKIILFSGLLLFFCRLRKHMDNIFTLLHQCLRSLVDNGGFFPLLIFAIAAGFMTFRALAPPTDWDSLTLHLRVPTQFLEKGNIYLPEDNLGSSFVQFVHMWYVPLLAFGSTAGPSLLSSFFALLLCLSAFAFSIHFLNPITASLSLAFFWANAVILLVAITPRVDVTLAFFLFAANYSLIKAIYNPLNFRCYYLSAVLFGISIGIKYNAFFYILAVSPLVFSAATSGSRGYSWCLRKLFIFGSLMAMSASPWLIKNIIQFHSPLYPFFAERQLEPWLADSYFNLSLQSSIIKSSIANSIQQMAKPFNLPDFIKNPGRLMVEYEGRFYTFNILFFILPLWGLFTREKALNWLMLPAFLYIFMLIAFWPLSNIRYLIPALIPLTIGGTYIIGNICSRFFKSLSRRKFYLYVFVFIALIPTAIMMYYWPSNEVALKYLIGSSSQKEYLLSKLMPTYIYADIVYYVNQNLSRKDKVLMLFEGRGYYFEVPVLQDNELTNWTLIPQENMTAKDLRRIGISHVLVNTKGPIYLQSRGVNLSIFRLEDLKRFSEKYLRQIYKNEGYILFALKD